jgi:hypothetical protein
MKMVGRDGLFFTILGSMLLLPSGIIYFEQTHLFNLFSLMGRQVAKFSGPETRLNKFHNFKLIDFMEISRR